MDGLNDRFISQLDTSAVAGKITSIIAERHARALRDHDEVTAARFDVGLDTVYFASLLLMIVRGSGDTRRRDEVVDVLDTAQDVIGELRAWMMEQMP